MGEIGKVEGAREVRRMRKKIVNIIILNYVEANSNFQHMIKKKKKNQLCTAINFWGNKYFLPKFLYFGRFLKMNIFFKMKKI